MQWVSVHHPCSLTWQIGVVAAQKGWEKSVWRMAWYDQVVSNLLYSLCPCLAVISTCHNFFWLLISFFLLNPQDMASVVLHKVASASSSLGRDPGPLCCLQLYPREHPSQDWPLCQPPQNDTFPSLWGRGRKAAEWESVDLCSSPAIITLVTITKFWLFLGLFPYL